MVRSLNSLYSESFAFRLTLGFAGAALLLALLGYLAVGHFEAFLKFDAAVREGVQRIAVQWLTSSLKIVTKLGSTLALAVVGITALVAFALLRWRHAVGLFLLAMAGQIILHHGFKALIARERPEPLLDYIVGNSYSFPSGHALASLSVYGIIAWLITNRIRSAPVKVSIWIFTSLLILSIGFSRIYFGVHNATDVIAGYAAALIWTATVASGDPPRRDG